MAKQAQGQSKNKGGARTAAAQRTSQASQAQQARRPQRTQRAGKAAWSRREPPQARALALMALVGVVAILAAWMAQSGGAFAPASGQSAEGGLRISEVMSANATALVTADGARPDWIELENASNAAVDLAGWALVSADQPAKALAFSGGALEPGACLVVYADGSAQARQADGWHAPFRISASGESLALLNPRGISVDAAEVPALAKDQSYCRDAQGSWRVSDFPTPGAANRAERADGASGALPEVEVAAGALEISEVMSKNATFFADETGACPDYVEVRNLTNAPVSLEGWYLSDKREKLKRWAFPAVTLPAGGQLAVHCSGVDRRADPAHLHANFKLSSEGDDVYLTEPGGATVSHVKVPALEADQAYSRLETGWSRSFAPTPGQPNTQAGADAAAEAIRARNDRGVYITEVLATSNRSDDWIEIHNGGAEAVDLSGYGLSDNARRPRKWQFPQGTVIAPGAYMGVFATGIEGSGGERLEAGFRLGAEGGYSVTLSDPEGGVFDRLFVPAQYQNISYGRAEADGAPRYFTSPTPGAANAGDAYLGRAALPVYSVPGGLYEAGERLSVALTVPTGCQVYYTLDNTDPDRDDTLYTGPIEVTETTILRTRVYGEGYLESFMDTQSYLFDVNNGDGTLFVVSLVSDPYNLTSDEAGIMIKGPNAWDTFPFGSLNRGANFWMDWEREAHVEIFNGDGSTLLSQECGIKLHGQYSRSEVQQAFKIIARGAYGSNRFQAPIFSKRPYTEYQSFLLRASGQDTKRTRMRDSVLSALAEDTSVMYQETELCVVYLDGRYWGQYNLRERINTASICQFEGWEGDEDDLDLVKANTNVMQGSNETMAKLLEWLKKTDTSTDRAYQAIDSVIDIQNYIEYMAIEMYTGNTDTLNVKRYRNPKADGKWRWVLFDLDWAFNQDTNSVARWLRPGGMGNQNRTDNTLFIACMNNPTFRDRFLTHLGREMATTFSAESMIKRFETRYNALKPVLADNQERWGRTMDAYNSAVKDLVDYAKTRPGRMLQFLKYAKALGLTQAEMEDYFGDVMRQVGVSYGQIKDPND